MDSKSNETGREASTAQECKRPWTLTNETKTSNRNIEHKERVHRNAHPIANDARATQDADSCSERPCNEDEIDGYSGNCRQSHRTEKGGNDQREEGVADDAN